ncbi:MAG: hypothetical protein AAFV77_10880, partial [Planctomycetota bacterium]
LAISPRQIGEVNVIGPDPCRMALDLPMSDARRVDLQQQERLVLSWKFGVSLEPKGRERNLGEDQVVGPPKGPVGKHIGAIIGPLDPKHGACGRSESLEALSRMKI